MNKAALIRKRIEEGLPTRRIAYEVGCSPKYVLNVVWRVRNPDRDREFARASMERRRRRLGMRPISETGWPNDLLNHAIELKKQGLSASEIGRVIGKTKNAVIGRLWRAGV